jgi:hypothetical protein
MKRLAPDLNIATSSTMLAHSLSGMKPLQMSLADWRKALVTALTARTQFSLSHAKPSQKEKIITYGRFVVDIRPNKSEVHRFRLTVGGNLIQYQGDVSTRSADLTTSKCLWNSTISTDGAKYMCLDVKNFYLGTPMDTFEYMRIPIKLIPHKIIVQYNLLPLVSDGHVYIEVQKGMYDLPQAGILANHLLARRLAIHCYHQTTFTLGLWRYVTRPVQFTLVVDNFGVQYVGAEHAHHLIAALETDYTVSKDWTGGLY